MKTAALIGPVQFVAMTYFICIVVSLLVGLGKTKELVLTGKMISVEEALSINLVNKVMPDEKLMEEAFTMAKMITRHSPIAVGLAKFSVQNAQDVDNYTGKIIERAAFSLAFTSDDQTEGMKAFLQKRKPSYKGK